MYVLGGAAPFAARRGGVAMLPAVLWLYADCSWRQTSGCSSTGKREPQNDRPCEAKISSDRSGFCECEPGLRVSPVGCGHAPLTCSARCSTATSSGGSLRPRSTASAQPHKQRSKPAKPTPTVVPKPKAKPAHQRQSAAQPGGAAPRVVTQHSTRVPTGTTEIVRTRSTVNNASGFIGLGTNPSVLAVPSGDHPECTHHLFRQPKTGSTALYNAAMLDSQLHSHVCWSSRQLGNIAPRDLNHIPPPKRYPFPVLVALRHPASLIEARLVYYGKDARGHGCILCNSQPVVLDAGSVRGWGSLLERWVPDQSRSLPAGLHDVFLCIGDDQCPDVTQQLRDAFGNAAITHIPYENVNHQNRTIISPQPLVAYAHPQDLKLWSEHCGKRCTVSGLGLTRSDAVPHFTAAVSPVEAPAVESASHEAVSASSDDTMHRALRNLGIDASEEVLFSQTRSDGRLPAVVVVIPGLARGCHSAAYMQLQLSPCVDGRVAIAMVLQFDHGTNVSPHDRFERRSCIENVARAASKGKRGCSLVLAEQRFTNKASPRGQACKTRLPDRVTMQHLALGRAFQTAKRLLPQPSFYMRARLDDFGWLGCVPAPSWTNSSAELLPQDPRREPRPFIVFNKFGAFEEAGTLRLLRVPSDRFALLPARLAPFVFETWRLWEGNLDCGHVCHASRVGRSACGWCSAVSQESRHGKPAKPSSECVLLSWLEAQGGAEMLPPGARARAPALPFQYLSAEGSGAGAIIARQHNATHYQLAQSTPEFPYVPGGVAAYADVGRRFGALAKPDRSCKISSAPAPAPIPLPGGHIWVYLGFLKNNWRPVSTDGA